MTILIIAGIALIIGLVVILLITGGNKKINYKDRIKLESILENEEQERSEFSKCSKHEQYLRKQDLKYLTDTINTYLFSWWD